MVGDEYFTRALAERERTGVEWSGGRVSNRKRPGASLSKVSNHCCWRGCCIDIGGWGGDITDFQFNPKDPTQPRRAKARDGRSLEMVFRRR